MECSQYMIGAAFDFLSHLNNAIFHPFLCSDFLSSSCKYDIYNIYISFYSGEVISPQDLYPENNGLDKKGLSLKRTSN